MTSTQQQLAPQHTHQQLQELHAGYPRCQHTKAMLICQVCSVQLPVVNLVTASCKAVFGTSTSSDSSKPPTAAAQLGIDPSACASYLYYM
jgi:hypothetical protein